MFYRYPCIRCKSLSSALRERLSKCPLFAGKLSGLSSEAEDAARDFDEEDEVTLYLLFRLWLFLFCMANGLDFFGENSLQVFVSAVMSRYMESKCKRKSVFGSDTSRWALSPQHFLLARKGSRESRSSGGGGEEDEEFSSAVTRLSRCSSAMSYDTFFSVKTRFSRSSSLKKIDSCKDFSRRCIIIQELMQYEGWPFGLCKKAFLLPPLPKSPSDSWSWRKNAGTATSVGSGWWIADTRTRLSSPTIKNRWYIDNYFALSMIWILCLFCFSIVFTKYVNWELSWIIEFLGKGYHFFPFLFDNFRIK